jgi:hypothetical protein
MKNKKLTLQEHIECANKLAVAQDLTEDVYKLCQSHFCKTSPLMKSFEKLAPYNINGAFAKLSTKLDNELELSVSRDDILKNEPFYFRIEERSSELYKQLCNECRCKIKPV